MGTAASSSSSSAHGVAGEAPDEVQEEQDRYGDGGGGQLYVSLQMENNHKLNKDDDLLLPHVFGSVALVGSWRQSKALCMERESASMWELSFVVPPNHETLDFKFLLKSKYDAALCIVEEGLNRQLIGGALQGDARNALFRISSDEVLEYRVFIKANRVSPFDLAASWRAYQANLRPSAVRGIPDVSIGSTPETGGENGSSSASLELDLEHYVVPAPASSRPVYAANNAETPRNITGVSTKSDGSIDSSYTYKDSGIPIDPSSKKEMEVVIPDSSKINSSSGMVESKSVGTPSPFQKQDSQRGLFVDRGVGSPRLDKSSGSYAFSSEIRKEKPGTKNSMPEAAGAVAAAAIADQMLGPKEDAHLAIVLVGLPARGKTFTAAKLTRYLRWLGHDTKHFNVGKYRRLKHGTNQSANFFRADNPEGMEARNE